MISLGHRDNRMTKKGWIKQKKRSKEDKCLVGRSTKNLDHHNNHVYLETELIIYKMLNGMFL